MDDEPLIYYTLRDPLHPQQYAKATDMSPLEINTYAAPYNRSMPESDNMNDSIKVKVLYNELMTLKAALRDTERRLMGEINYLNNDHRRLVEENKRLSDEITAIKQGLYFG